jgi:hypothetical protein
MKNENNDPKSFAPTPNQDTKSPSWMFSSVGLIVTFSLFVIVVGVYIDRISVYFDLVVWNRRTISLLLYRIDPRYWAISIVPFLWGAVFWLFADFLSRFDYVYKWRGWIRFVIILGVLLSLALLYHEIVLKVRNEIYSIYITHLVSPIFHYLAIGVWSWKILIVPLVVATTIAILLYFTLKNRNQKT